MAHNIYNTWSFAAGFFHLAGFEVHQISCISISFLFIVENIPLSGYASVTIVENIPLSGYTVV